MRALFGLGLLLALVLGAAPGHAQTNSDAADPPARVGRIARIAGTVSYRPAAVAEWEAASVNQPLSTGGGVWSEPRGRVDVEIGASRIVLDGNSNLEFESLDDRAVAMVLPQGGAYLRLRDIQPGETVQVRTPRGLVTLGQILHYFPAHDLTHLVQIERALIQPFLPGVGPWADGFQDMHMR